MNNQERTERLARAILSHSPNHSATNINVDISTVLAGENVPFSALEVKRVVRHALTDAGYEAMADAFAMATDPIRNLDAVVLIASAFVQLETADKPECPIEDEAIEAKAPPDPSGKAGDSPVIIEKKYDKDKCFIYYAVLPDGTEITTHDRLAALRHAFDAIPLMPPLIHDTTVTDDCWIVVRDRKGKYEEIYFSQFDAAVRCLNIWKQSASYFK